MSSRRSRRLAGLPPVEPEDHNEEETLRYKEEVIESGLVYTEAARLEYVWLTIVFVFILFPMYLFLANS
jgi:hypothetical protein